MNHFDWRKGGLHASELSIRPTCFWRVSKSKTSDMPSTVVRSNILSLLLRFYVPLSWRFLSAPSKFESPFEMLSISFIFGLEPVASFQFCFSVLKSFLWTGWIFSCALNHLHLLSLDCYRMALIRMKFSFKFFDWDPQKLRNWNSRSCRLKIAIKISLETVIEFRRGCQRASSRLLPFLVIFNHLLPVNPVVLKISISCESFRILKL